MFSIRNDKNIPDVLAELGIIGNDARKLQTQLSAYLRRCHRLRNPLVRVDDNDVFRWAADFLSWAWRYQPGLHHLSSVLDHDIVVEVLARVLKRQDMCKNPLNTRLYVAALPKHSQLHPTTAGPVPHSTTYSVSSVHPARQTQHYAGPQRGVLYDNTDDIRSPSTMGQLVRPFRGSEGNRWALSSSLGKRAAVEPPDNTVNRVHIIPHTGSTLTKDTLLSKPHPIERPGSLLLPSQGFSPPTFTPPQSGRLSRTDTSDSDLSTLLSLTTPTSMAYSITQQSAGSPSRAQLRDQPSNLENAHTRTTSETHQLVSTDNHPKPLEAEADCRRRQICSDGHQSEPPSGSVFSYYSGPSFSPFTPPDLAEEERTHAASNRASYDSASRFVDGNPVTDEVGDTDTEEDEDTITVLIPVVDLTDTDSSIESDGPDDDARPSLLASPPDIPDSAKLRAKSKISKFVTSAQRMGPFDYITIESVDFTQNCNTGPCQMVSSATEVDEIRHTLDQTTPTADSLQHSLPIKFSSHDAVM